MIQRDIFQAKVEQARVLARKRLVRTIATALILSILIMIFSIQAGPDGMVGIIFGMFVGVIVVCVIDTMYAKPARKAFEYEVMALLNAEVFSKRFGNTTFDRDFGFDESYLKTKGVIDHGNIYKSNDSLQGTYKGVDFKRADVLAQQRTSTGKTTVTTTLFQGQVYEFDFHKPFENYIRIRNKGDFFGGFSKGRKTDGSHRMSFENSEFNNRFHIYSNDEHQAYYVFTPHFMERVMDLDSRVQSPMSLVLKDGMMTLALYTSRDSFETSVFRGIDDHFITMMNQDVEIIASIIEGLNLDSTLFDPSKGEKHVK